MEDKREELDVEKDVNTPKKEELTKKQSLAAIFISILIVIVVVTAGVLVGLKEKKGPEEHYYKLNEKFNFYNLEFTIMDCKSGSYYVNPETYNTTEPENDNNLLVSVKVKAFNPTKNKIELRDGEWFLANSNLSYTLLCDGVKYNGKFSDSKAFFQAAYDIEPYETIEGDLLYEVPKQLFENCEKLELRISLNKNKIDEVYIIDLTSGEI